MKIIKFNGEDCIVKKSKYINNDNLALVLMEIGEYADPSPIAYITVNTDDKLDSDLSYVKDYSENEGMLEACQKAGLVKEILGVKQLGWVTAPLVRFNMADIEEL